VYWKGFEPSELLEHNALTVATITNLSFQVGRSLLTILEGKASRTILASNSLTADYSHGHEVCMASIREIENNEPGSEYENELLDEISADEGMVQAPADEDKEQQRIYKLKNARRANCRRNAQARTRNINRSLNGKFAAVRDH
jgi:hypothetical protein